MRENTLEGECIDMFPLLGRTAMEVVSRYVSVVSEKGAVCTEILSLEILFCTFYHVLSVLI